MTVSAILTATVPVDYCRHVWAENRPRVGRKSNQTWADYRPHKKQIKKQLHKRQQQQNPMLLR